MSLRITGRFRFHRRLETDSPPVEFPIVPDFSRETCNARYAHAEFDWWKSGPADNFITTPPTEVCTKWGGNEFNNYYFRRKWESGPAFVINSRSNV